MTKQEKLDNLKDDMVNCYDNGDAMMEHIEAYYLKYMNNLIAIQKDSLTDNYMIGMYNGMVLMRSVIDNKTPEYIDTTSNTIATPMKDSYTGYETKSMVEGMANYYTQQKCQNCKHFTMISECSVIQNPLVVGEIKDWTPPENFSCNLWNKQDA